MYTYMIDKRSYNTWNDSDSPKNYRLSNKNANSGQGKRSFELLVRRVQVIPKTIWAIVIALHYLPGLEGKIQDLDK